MVYTAQIGSANNKIVEEKRGHGEGERLLCWKKNVEEHRMGKFVGVMVAVVEGV